jgi:hypothetical protein
VDEMRRCIGLEGLAKSRLRLIENTTVEQETPPPLHHHPKSHPRSRGDRLKHHPQRT